MPDPTTVVDINKYVSLDIEKLVSTRALIQATSGGGKSYLLRLIVEQCADRIPVIVIDPEGEFHTVRSACSMVLVGDGGELPCNIKTASVVARGLLEHGCSAVIDLSELDAELHAEYVGLFLRAVMSAPRKLWRPTVIAIDEAHRFCPEGAATASSGAVIDLMCRGRKRRYGGVLLSQRVSKLSKDAIAEANNQFFGLTTLDIDIKRSADMLGLSKREAGVLRTLAPGEWMSFGPAVYGVEGVEKIQAVMPQTEPPDPQSAVAPSVKSADALSAMAGEIAEAMESGEDVQSSDDHPVSIQDAEKKISQLRADLEAAQESARVGVSARDLDEKLKRCHDNAIQAGIRRGVEVAGSHMSAAMAELQDRADRAEISYLSNSFQAGGIVGDAEPVHDSGFVENAVRSASKSLGVPSKPPAIASGSATDRVLYALGWWRSVSVYSPSAAMLCFVAGISAKSSTYRASRSSLRSRGLVEYDGGGTRLTEAGVKHVGDVVDVPTISGWHHMVRDQIGGGVVRDVFDVVVDVYPSPVDMNDLCKKIDVSPTSSTIRSALAGLRKLGLIEKGAPVRGTKLLYPESLS